MDLKFNIDTVLPGLITCYNSDLKIQFIYNQNDDTESMCQPSILQNKSYLGRCFEDQVVYMIDHIGKASAKAQKLNRPVTYAEYFEQSDHLIYILRDAKPDGELTNLIIGFLKVGHKHLSLCDLNSSVYKLSPLCVLDFYIYESKQRLNFGQFLFNCMLKCQNENPVNLAYDRPSDKLLSFLSKHYHLTNPIHQFNNYVIFPGFFENQLVENRHSKNSNKYGELCATNNNPLERRYADKNIEHQDDFIENYSPTTLESFNHQNPKETNPKITTNMIDTDYKKKNTFSDDGADFKKIAKPHRHFLHSHTPLW